MDSYRGRVGVGGEMVEGGNEEIWEKEGRSRVRRDRLQ
jgi:hypothetical protein